MPRPEARDAPARAAVPRTVAALAVAASLMSATAAAGPRQAAAVAGGTAVSKSLDYLTACQRPSGGFGEKVRADNEQLTAWAIVAIASAGEDPAAWRPGGRSPVDYLASKPSAWRSTTDLARTALAVVAAGRDPRRFADRNLIAEILADRRDDGGAGDHFGPYVNSHIWAVLALRAAGQSVSAREVAWLKNQQNPDGGWSWAQSLASDTNDTAAAIQALMAAGESKDSTTTRDALDYLDAHQLADGGFSYLGSISDANSTAWVVQGLLAAGQSPTASRWRTPKGDPLSRLRALQRSDGAVRYSSRVSSNPLICTVQAIPAFAGRPFPVRFPSPASATPDRSPRLTALVPARGGAAPALKRFTVRFALADEAGGTGVSPSSIRFTLDGKTLKPVVRGAWAGLTVGPLSRGRHVISVSAADRAGNTAELTGWSFTADPAVAQADVAQGGRSQSPVAGAPAAGGSSAQTSSSAGTAVDATRSPAATATASGPPTANDAFAANGQTSGPGPGGVLNTLGTALSAASGTPSGYAIAGVVLIAVGLLSLVVTGLVVYRRPLATWALGLKDRMLDVLRVKRSARP